MMPENTSVDGYEIKFNLNQNLNYQVECFRIMKDWYDLSFNYTDGTLHYKRNCIGDIIIHVHDKEGHVIRRVTYHDVMVHAFTGWEELNWESGAEIADLSIKFAADYWEDLYY